MLKDRKKPTDHRQGKLVKLLDLIQRFSNIHHDKNYWQTDKDNRFDEGHINPEHQIELDDMMRELRAFDVTEIGNLYLTSGGRIVLDKGYGEYFGKSDKVIFTLKELTAGMNAKRFVDAINKLKV